MKKAMKILALLLVLTMLAGCGSISNSVSKSEAALDFVANETWAPAAPEVPAGGALSSVSDSATQEANIEQKLIKRVSMDAETEDLEALLPQLMEEISALGGYVESQEVYNGSSYSSSYRYRNAQLIIRVPAENLNGLVNQVKGASNVVNYNESVEDVTLAYVDMETRILVLEAERDRLLELMEKAETMSDLLEIEARLTQVRGDLESINAQLRVLANQVSYATIELYISQVKVYTEVEEQTVWQRIGTGFIQNLEDLGESLVDFFVWVIIYSPQLILWGGIITLIVILIRRKPWKKKVKEAPRKDMPQE